jgi:hypothetical protein
MVERSGGRGAIPQIPWVFLLGALALGIFSLLNLYLGFQAYASGRPEQASYYILIGSMGFAAMGYMFFRARAPPVRRMLIPRVEVVTTIECPSCGLKRVRSFERGDYIFRRDIPCTKCGGQAVITRIHRKRLPEEARQL